MTAEGERAAAEAVPPGAEARVSVDARQAEGVAIGEHITQINHYYGPGPTWSDGVVARSLVDISGRVESPYRGLSAFEERDAAFFLAAARLRTRSCSACQTH
jgi:hypothetical protein